MNIEQEIAKIYNEYKSAISEETAKVFESLIKQDKLQRQKVTQGTISVKEYKRWLRLQLSTQKYKELLEKIADDIAVMNDKCIDVIEKHKEEEYKKGINAGLVMLAAGLVGAKITRKTHKELSSIGIAVNVTAKEKNILKVEKAKAVSRLYNIDKADIETLPSLLPKPSEKTLRRIRREKLKRWNMQTINSQIVTGVRKGESIPKIARRLQKTVDMDKNASARNARTATGALQNNAMQKVAEDAERAGIEIKKMWLATLDNRTRDSHAHMDGTEINVKDKFDVNGSEMLYPKDPNGDPAEVYNCRCRLVYNVNKNLKTENVERRGR